MSNIERKATGAFRFGARESKRESGATLDRVSKIALALAALFGLLAVSPFLADAHQFPKFASFAILTAISGILWAVARLGGGEIKLGKMAWMPALAVVATAVVAAFSGGWAAWLAGPDRQPFSFATVFALSAFLFLGWQHLREEDLPKLRVALGAVFAIVAAFFLARTFLPLPLFLPKVGLSLLSAAASDLAVMAAVSVVLSLYTLFDDKESRLKKGFFAATGVLSFAVLVLVGAPKAWAAMLVGSLGLFSIAVRSLGWKDWRTVVVAVAVALSVPMSIWGTPGMMRLALPAEVRLGVADSARLGGAELMSGVKGFVVGVGLGRYPLAFAANRPARINASEVYSAVSVQPTGVLPFLAVEGGLFLLLAALAITLAIAVAAVSAAVGCVDGAGRVKGLPKRYRLVWSALGLAMILTASMFSVPPFPIMVMSVLALLALSVGYYGQSTRVIEAKGGASKALMIAAAAVSVAFAFQVSRMALAECYFGRALIAYSEGRTEDSLRAVLTAVKFNPDPRYTLGVAQARAKLAVSSPERPELVAVAVEALRASEANPSDLIDYHVAFGNTAAQFYAQDPGEAKRMVSSAVSSATAASPANPALRLWAGDMMFAVGDPESAASEYREAILQRSGFTQALVHYAQLLAVPGESEDKDAAFDLLKRAFESSPQSKDVLGMFVSAATSRRKPGDIDMALAALLNYLKSNPEDTQVISAYAGIAASDGRVEDAKAAYARLLELTPDDSAAKAALEKLGTAAASTPK